MGQSFAARSVNMEAALAREEFEFSKLGPAQSRSQSQSQSQQQWQPVSHHGNQPFFYLDVAKAADGHVTTLPYVCCGLPRDASVMFSSDFLERMQDLAAELASDKHKQHVEEVDAAASGDTSAGDGDGGGVAIAEEEVYGIESEGGTDASAHHHIEVVSKMARMQEHQVGATNLVS